MALLSNTPVRYALLLTFDATARAAVDGGSLRTLVEDVRNVGAAVTAFAGTDLDRAPIMIARDSWLDLMTLGEQGMAAVTARRGLREI
jgi:hypothetical protein